MERAELTRVLQGWLGQFADPRFDIAQIIPSEERPELPFRVDDPPAMAWLRDYLDEAQQEFPVGQTFRAASLATVTKLPLPGISELEVAIAAFKLMLRIMAERIPNPYATISALRALLVYLLPRVKPDGPSTPLALLRSLQDHPQAWGAYGVPSYIPTPQVVRAAVRMIKSVGWTTELRAAAEGVHAAGGRLADDAERRKANAALGELLETSAPQERLIDATDDWGVPAQTALQSLTGDLRSGWLRLLAHAAAGTGSRTTVAWLREARVRVEELGTSESRRLIESWLALLSARGAGHPVGPESAFGEMRPGAMIPERNADLLRGLVWTCLLFDDDAMARTVGQAARECFRKIPDFGSRSTKAGNACLYVLGQLRTVAGVTQLQQLEQSLKLPSVQKAIDAALRVASERAGLSRDDLEELSVPTFGLEDGRVEWQMGAHRAELVVEGSSVTTRWYGPDGKLLHGVPASARKDFGPQVKAALQTSKDLAAALHAQRDRVEALYLKERSWSYAVWKERYLDHPLLSTLARRLIWELRAPDRITLATWLDERLVDVGDQPVEAPPGTEVHLWHPAGSPANDVLAWRTWLSQHEVRQPFKQAHREIYLLTDAERATATYSHRFAAHVLRQHQFTALCQERGWRYRLQGDFDGWNAPRKLLPVHGLSVQFDVEASDVGVPTSRMGLYLYVTSDRVHFASANPHGPVLLSDVPPLVFSEVMRDVDLFVGVCSVGNDPTWAANGPEPFRQYWTTYAAGELSTSAQTRREVLGELLPRLKIAPRCSLEERFLVVRGDLRTYRIHLGSGNILMEPNNHYLCIVPTRGGGIETSGGQVFLPFEGDGMLAIILSKAFLLADDRSITDPSIIRQLA